ncbi:hypothetical protein K0M31_015227 [Melipona bicolor]|uniref:Uncharacterized protein n=1 Tax=Melipona bicolor TaxID=60889 RepID=A0AA40FGS0_9HYME|nr:hypothetical protein K0M31_015227 [Melipona bicolor]
MVIALESDVTAHCYQTISPFGSTRTEERLEPSRISSDSPRYPAEQPSARACTEIKAGESIVTIRMTRRIAGKVIFGTRTLGSGWPRSLCRRFEGGWGEEEADGKRRNASTGSGNYSGRKTNERGFQ